MTEDANDHGGTWLDDPQGDGVKLATQLREGDRIQDHHTSDLGINDAFTVHDITDVTPDNVTVTGKYDDGTDHAFTCDSGREFQVIT